VNLLPPARAGALVTFVSLTLTAFAEEPTAILSAVDARDVGALERAVESKSGPDDERSLASGVLLALRGRDDAAVTALSRSAHRASSASTVRRRAFAALVDVWMRQGRYAQAAAAGDEAIKLGDASTDMAMNRDFSAALRSASPMTGRATRREEVETRRDAAGLPRASLTVNGQTVQALIDTGAAFSTMNASTAARLHARFVGPEVTVRSSSADAVNAHLAVAAKLKFGSVEFENVVFIVFPDAALSFADGAYTIDAIVGLPVLRRLRCLEFADGEQDRGHLYLGPATRLASGDSNLILDGLQPIALVGVDRSEVRLRMLVDTGADKTQLKELAVHDFPSLGPSGTLDAFRIGGAGAVVAQQATPAIPTLALKLSTAIVSLSDVPVLAGNNPVLHGVLGQDLLNSRHGYTVNFDAMQITLAGGRSP
jgi:predicted aspartyl protease